LLELDSAQSLFQSKLVLAGPGELLATLKMGRVEEQNFTFGDSAQMRSDRAGSA